MFQKIIKAIMPATKMIDLFTFKIESNKPISEVISKVPLICEQNKFALLQTYVYHEIVESKGFPINRKVYIYEICQAKVAASMLTDFPQFSIFMPCKIAIYEENGKTIIATMNMGIMLDAVQSKKELYDEATAMFNTLKLMMTTL